MRTPSKDPYQDKSRVWYGLRDPVVDHLSRNVNGVIVSCILKYETSTSLIGVDHFLHELLVSPWQHLTHQSRLEQGHSQRRLKGECKTFSLNSLRILHAHDINVFRDQIKPFS